MPEADLEHQVEAYLRRQAITFWRYSPYEGTVVWDDGKTLAFRGEIRAALKRLAPNGLPPFGALLLVIAASRKSWALDERRRELVTDVASALSAQGFELPRGWLPQILVGLDSLNQTVQRLAGESAAHAEIPELVLGDCPNRTSPQVAEAVCRHFDGEHGEDFGEMTWRLHAYSSAATAFDCFLNEMRALRDGLEKVDAELLRTRAQTGVEDVVESADEAAEVTESARGLIDLLREDEVYSGIGRLARDLLAAIHLPRKLERATELPIGGVTDITNRGPLDRLLVSELAQDDLTLAVRVAMNEALYLRREDPPDQPMIDRRVLVDVGIRQWGVPRLFAAAVGLALAAGGDEHVHVSAYSADADEVVPIDFTTREGLVDLLGRLCADRHPARAINTLADMPAPELADLVVVTHADTFHDRQFRNSWSVAEGEKLFVIAIDRDGTLELWDCAPQVAVQLNKLKLDLADILPNESARRQVVDDDIDPSLPAILRQRPFPLYLPQRPNAERAWSVPGRSTLVLTKDRRLLAFSSPTRGGLQLLDDAPSGHVWCASVEPGSRTRAIAGSAKRSELITVDLDTLECDRVLLETPAAGPIQSAFLLDGMPVLVTPKTLAMCSPDDGRVVSTFSLAGSVRHYMGRFFTSGSSSWYAIVRHGFTLASDDKLKMPNRMGMAAVFETQGIDGPIGVQADGAIHYFNDQHLNWTLTEQRIQGAITMSRDGRRGKVGHRGGRGMFTISDNRKVSLNRIYREEQFEPRLHEQVKDRTMRKRVSGVGINDQGTLLISVPKGRVLMLTKRNELIQFARVVQTRDLRFVHFRPIGLASDWGFTLSEAKLGGGGRIVLDSRGLLHLQPGDDALPQVTLTLEDHLVSGWCSDGTIWGDPFVVGQEPRTSPDEVLQRIIRPILADMQ